MLFLLGLDAYEGCILETYNINYGNKYFENRFINRVVSVAELDGVLPSIEFLKLFNALAIEKFCTGRVFYKDGPDQIIVDLDEYLSETHFEYIIEYNSASRSTNNELCQSYYDAIKDIPDPAKFIDSFAKNIDRTFCITTICRLIGFNGFTASQSQEAMAFAFHDPYLLHLLRILYPRIYGWFQIEYLLRRNTHGETQLFTAFLDFFRNEMLGEETKSNIFEYFKNKMTFIAVHTVFRLRFNMNFDWSRHEIRFGGNPGEGGAVLVDRINQNYRAAARSSNDLHISTFPVYRCKTCGTAVRAVDGIVTNIFSDKDKTKLFCAEWILLSHSNNAKPTNTNYEKESFRHTCGLLESNVENSQVLEDTKEMFLSAFIRNDIYRLYNLDKGLPY